MAKRKLSREEVRNFLLIEVFAIFMLFAVVLSLNDLGITGRVSYGGSLIDLGDYPFPFIEENDFNGIIVIGDNAAVGDAISASSIASSLTSEITLPSGDNEISISGENVKVEGTKVLTLGSDSDGLKEIVRTGFDKDDLATILADNTFTNKEGNSYDYTQKLEFAANVNFQHKADNDYKNKEPNLMIFSDKNTLFMTYTLDFKKSAVSDDVSNTLEDYLDRSIEILGKTYDITSATKNGDRVSLTLMGGTIQSIMSQGEIKTFELDSKDYQVKVTYIGGADSKVKFNINGELTDSLSVGGTYKLNSGVLIGVREILEEEVGEEFADQVQFYLGAEKIELVDTDYSTEESGTKSGDNVQIDNEVVEGLYHDIIGSYSNSEFKIDEIKLTWIPDDELFITKENSEAFPGLNSFKVTYEEFTTPTEEETRVSASGDVIELRTVLESGGASIELLGTDGATFTQIGGDSTGDILRTAANAGATITFDSDTDQYFIGTYIDGAAGESYLIEINDIDDTDGVDFRAGGNSYENKRAGTFNIGSIELTLANIDETNNNVDITACGNCYFDRLVTAQGLHIALPVDGVNVNVGASTTFDVVVTEEDRDENIASGVAFNINTGVVSSDADVTGISTATLSNTNYYEIGDTNNYISYVASDLGTKIIHDSDDAKITYHGGESYASVYVSEIASKSGTVKKGSGKLPITKLASEVNNAAAQNIIAIGGPYNNPITAEFISYSDWPYSEGQAMIKLFKNGNNVVLVVAGTTKEDTRRAGSVLSDYQAYNLGGKEVCVTGGLSTAQVTKGECK